jgi:ATP-dependent Clp protease adaptor protein ClpS
MSVEEKSDQTSDQTTDQTTATLPAEPKRKTQSAAKPKRQPPYAVVLLNDPLHSMGYVIDVLRAVFGYTHEKAGVLMMEAHSSGRAIVWTGALETAEFKRDRIRAFGPDFNVWWRKVDFPLGCVLEPLPE